MALTKCERTAGAATVSATVLIRRRRSKAGACHVDVAGYEVHPVLLDHLRDCGAEKLWPGHGFLRLRVVQVQREDDEFVQSSAWRVEAHGHKREATAAFRVPRLAALHGGGEPCGDELFALEGGRPAVRPILQLASVGFLQHYDVVSAVPEDWHQIAAIAARVPRAKCDLGAQG